VTNSTASSSTQRPFSLASVFARLESTRRSLTPSASRNTDSYIRDYALKSAVAINGTLRHVTLDGPTEYGLLGSSNEQGEAP